jgi:hypothetical protein
MDPVVVCIECENDLNVEYAVKFKTPSVTCLATNVILYTQI